jgi:hypothetical protein
MGLGGFLPLTEGVIVKTYALDVGRGRGIRGVYVNSSVGKVEMHGIVFDFGNDIKGFGLV